MTNCSRRTRVGNTASLAGANIADIVSITRVANRIARMSANGIIAMITPRPTWAPIITCLRSHRSTSIPATGPSSRLGSTRAAITPDTAKAAKLVGPRIWPTSAMMARKPIQSPTVEISVDRARLRNPRFLASWR